MLLEVNREALEALTCVFPTCRNAPVGIYYMPRGCICHKDTCQALCAQHIVSAESAGPIYEILSLVLPAEDAEGDA